MKNPMIGPPLIIQFMATFNNDKVIFFPILSLVLSLHIHAFIFLTFFCRTSYNFQRSTIHNGHHSIRSLFTWDMMEPSTKYGSDDTKKECIWQMDSKTSGKIWKSTSQPPSTFLPVTITAYLTYISYHHWSDKLVAGRGIHPESISGLFDLLRKCWMLLNPW